MNADTAAQILFWLAVAGFISGLVYLAHRLTAPAAQRMNDATAQRHYAVLAARVPWPGRSARPRSSPQFSATTPRRSRCRSPSG